MKNVANVFLVFLMSGLLFSSCSNEGIVKTTEKNTSSVQIRKSSKALIDALKIYGQK